MNGRKWLIGGAVLFAVLGVAGLIGGSTPSSGMRMIPPTATPLSQFRSRYPWVPAVRTDDGTPGHFVYAEVDRLPAGWPPAIGTVTVLGEAGSHQEPTQGVWQFVPDNGEMAAPFAPHYREQWPVQRSRDPWEELRWLCGDEANDPIGFHLTLEGRAVLYGR
jgi:hypothetical protein